MSLILSLVIAVVALTAQWLIGNKNPLGFWLGLFNQIPWLALAWVTEAWGLLILSGVFVVVYIRNIKKWRNS